MDSLRKHKHAILVAALVGVALVESFGHRQVLGPVLSDLAIITMLLLVFLIVFDRRAFFAFVTITAVDVAHYILPGSAELPLQVIFHCAGLLLVGSAALVILRNILEQRSVRADDVLGAVCGYLLAAAAWSNLFMLIEIFLPGSFSVDPRFSIGIDTWYGQIAVLNYVSLGSLTGVGSSGVVPVRPPATMLTTFEAMFGQFYIAVVVAQLVGAKLSQALQRNDSPRR